MSSRAQRNLAALASFRAMSVASADGTSIACYATGDGPAAVVVPGAMSTAADYAEFADALGAGRTAVVMDRRGHGRSDPRRPGHRIDDDVADLRTVVAEVGATAVVGHSYGGLVALEAAGGGLDVTKVAVYEPGVSIDGSIPVGWAAAYESRLAHGAPFDAFAEFARGTTPALARAPLWLVKLAVRSATRKGWRERRFPLLGHNLADHREIARLDNSYHRYAAIAAEVLLMHGGRRSPTPAAPTARVLAAVLPRARIERFPKLGHFGPEHEGPREVAATVAAFLAG